MTAAGISRALIAAGFLSGLILVLAGCVLAACCTAPVLTAAAALAVQRWQVPLRRRLTAPRRTRTGGAVDRA